MKQKPINSLGEIPKKEWIDKYKKIADEYNEKDKDIGSDPGQLTGEQLIRMVQKKVSQGSGIVR